MNLPSAFLYMLYIPTNKPFKQEKITEFHWQIKFNIIRGPLTMDYFGEVTFLLNFQTPQRLH